MHDVNKAFSFTSVFFFFFFWRKILQNAEIIRCVRKPLLLEHRKPLTAWNGPFKIKNSFRVYRGKYDVEFFTEGNSCSGKRIDLERSRGIATKREERQKVTGITFLKIYRKFDTTVKKFRQNVSSLMNFSHICPCNFIRSLNLDKLLLYDIPRAWNFHRVERQFFISALELLKRSQNPEHS